MSEVSDAVIRVRKTKIETRQSFGLKLMNVFESFEVM